MRNLDLETVEQRTCYFGIIIAYVYGVVHLEPFRTCNLRGAKDSRTP